MKLGAKRKGEREQKAKGRQKAREAKGKGKQKAKGRKGKGKQQAQGSKLKKRGLIQDRTGDLQIFSLTLSQLSY